MHTNKPDIMTILVLIALLGILLTMGMSHIRGTTAPDALSQNHLNIKQETQPDVGRFMNASGIQARQKIKQLPESRI